MAGPQGAGGDRMKQKCAYCNKEVEVGETGLPYPVLCDGCAPNYWETDSTINQDIEIDPRWRDYGTTTREG